METFASSPPHLSDLRRWSLWAISVRTGEVRSRRFCCATTNCDVCLSLSLSLPLSLNFKVLDAVVFSGCLELLRISHATAHRPLHTFLTFKLPRGSRSSFPDSMKEQLLALPCTSLRGYVRPQQLLFRKKLASLESELLVEAC